LRTFVLLAIAAVLQSAAPSIELPAGKAAEATARIPAGTAAAALPAVAEDAWTKPATWKRYGELLAAEASSPAPDPGRRAELALLALAQRRYEDAWARYAECASSPATLAALLPRFLPGRTAGPSVFAPALPPIRVDVQAPPRGYVQRRAMRIGDLAVGGAVVAMRVSVEAEGVEIDVEHVSGPAVKLSIRIPEDPEFGFSDEYVDWYRQEARGIPHEVEVKPGDEAHTLYARFEPRRPEWPTREPELVPAQLENGMIRLFGGSSADERKLGDAVAAFLSSSPLRISAEAVDSKTSGTEPFGVAIDLSRAGERPRKLAWIAGSVERRLLSPDSRRPKSR
jgi:hypothetical protein